jgi:leader peptidase (prepilin peptidase)/N-methyltransferase
MNNLLVDKIRIAVCLLLLLAEGIMDKRRKRILLPPLFIGFAAGVVLSFLQGKEDGLFALFGIIPGVLFLGIAAATREKVGYGDGLVLIATGVLLGLRINLMMVFLGLFLAALCSIWLLIRKKAGRNTKIAFVPFLLPALALSLAMSGGFS